MRRAISLLILLAGILLACEPSGNNSQNTVKLTSKKDSMSYAVGAMTFAQLKGMGIDVKKEAFKKGYEEGMAGSGMSKVQAQEVLNRFNMAVQGAQDAPFSEDNPLNMDVDSVFQALGKTFSLQVSDFDLDLSAESLSAGVADQVSGDSMAMSQTQINAYMAELNQQVRAKQQEKIQKEAPENLAKGQAFLAEKAQEDGVQSTESGLLYKVIEEGSGPSPTATDKVKVHYEGTLIDGTVFDSSIERGEPVTFPVSGVIQGWIEGLQLMKTGAKYEFYIPSDLAYGERGQAPDIGPNETLIFEVNLIEIISQPQNATE